MKISNTLLTLLVLCFLSTNVFAQPGSNDPSFNTLDDGTYGDITGFDNAILTTNFLGDGKIIVAGGFSSYNGTTRNYIARLNTDGSLDNTFDTGEGFNNWIRATSIQADGKIIAAGEFSQYDGVWRNRIARINNCSPLDNTVSVNGNILSANATGVSYQWINCNNNMPIANQTNQSFTPTVSGNYAVIVSQNGCEETSDCTIVTVTGIDEIGQSSIGVYPNPTSGMVTIKLGKEYSASSIKLINALGQTVLYNSTASQSDINFEIIGEPGIYLLEIETHQGTQARIRVIKN